MRLQRDAWQQAQPLLDPAKLVFIDETGFDTNAVKLSLTCIGAVASGWI
ncbi:MAG: hypothetical protein PHG00_13520 [Methylococcales bacterium]|nr:hypothetical protein [Methylococcales bacterium]